MKRLSIRARADADIDAAIDYLTANDRVAAVRFIDQLEAACARIARRPASGSPRYAELTGVEGLRTVPIKGLGHHVFYIELEQTVVIIRVLHARRDIPALLIAT